MGKTSSSRRKKRSMISSKKSRKTSRSKKLKSKKLQNRDDSTSYSDGGSSKFSSSDSEDDNKRRKHRSSNRKNGKKRAKKPSSSREDHSRLRRKRSRKNSYEAKNKTSSKKKRKRDLSISSFSSESRSCSTCRSESRRTIESEFDSDRGRSEKRHSKKRDLENSRSVNKYGGYRSRSCSPYSSCGQRSNYSANEENINEYNYNSKRLKSVIVVQGNENRDHSDEERVEEITFGDSAFEEELMQDTGRKPEVIFATRNLKLGDTEKDSKYQSKGAEVPVDERKNNFSGDTVSKSDVDMELILRQKALENLKRFRGGIEKRTKPDDNQEVESLKVDSGNLVHLKPSKEEDFKTLVATEAVKGIDLGKEQSNSAHSSQNILDGRDGGGLKEGSSYSAVEESMDQAINKSEEKSSDQKSNEHYSVPTEPPSLAIMPTENSSSTKPLNDSCEGSQFEQKTMSVMRGGEMVEVSYKVYIPKKTPALSRRQLKR